MGTWASVMTGKGMGAIATIQVLGEQAGPIVGRLFRPEGSGPFDPAQGRIFLGSVVDGDEPIDQVVVGCEDRDLLAVHCHGNPLIVETLMVLLERGGATPVAPDALLTRVLCARGADSLQIEARLAQAKVRTLEAALLIAHQACGGLRAWLRTAEGKPLPDLKAEAGRILADSEAGRRVIEGCTGVLVGPPNTGKSTLLNWLAGQEKSLVSDIQGTTRDWVQAECRLGPLCLDLIDTAGLGSQPAATPDADVERAAQERTLHWVKRADLVLLVLDGSRSVDQMDSVPLDRLRDRPCVTVINKSDLQARLDVTLCPALPSHRVQVSAAHRTGRQALAEAVGRVCGVSGFSLSATVAFTPRQLVLIERLGQSRSLRQAARHVDEILHGPIQEGPPLCR